VRDAGLAITVLCEAETNRWREVELGGTHTWSIAEYLAAMRDTAALPPAVSLRVPKAMARLVSHGCDLFRLTPFSFGHLELLRHDNVPQPNLLPMLLGRAPTPVARVPREPAAEPGQQPA
jgi:hypothetical protein